jgi:hypothetical protein
MQLQTRNPWWFTVQSLSNQNIRCCWCDRKTELNNYFPKSKTGSYFTRWDASTESKGRFYILLTLHGVCVDPHLMICRHQNPRRVERAERQIKFIVTKCPPTLSVEEQNQIKTVESGLIIKRYTLRALMYDAFVSWKSKDKGEWNVNAGKLHSGWFRLFLWILFEKEKWRVFDFFCRSHHHFAEKTF